MDKYYKSYSQIAERYSLKNSIDLRHLIGVPDALNISFAPISDDIYTSEFMLLLDQAIEKVITMRSVEGNALSKDIHEKLTIIEQIIVSIKKRIPEVRELYLQKLRQRLDEILEIKLDEQRLYQELAIFSDRADVEEELIRLDAHISQFRQILSEDAPIGRKLDFLTQEMVRETNTLGSKSQDLFISSDVVKLKSIIEQIKEQIQNIL